MSLASYYRRSQRVVAIRFAIWPAKSELRPAILHAVLRRVVITKSDPHRN